MKLNQIIITGATNQELRTKPVEEPVYYLDKSVQFYFRSKAADQLLTVINPIFEQLNNSGAFDKKRLYDLYDIDIGIRFRHRFRKSKKELESTAELSTEYLEFLEEEKKVLVELYEEKERLLMYDSQTYLELYTEVLPKIVYRIIKEGGDLVSARDVFQNALIVLLERLKNENFVLSCKAGTYLHSVSVNIWRNLRRTEAQRKIQIEINSFSDTLEESIYFEEIPQQYEKVAAILEKMGDPCKSLLESFYFNQLSWEAIAEKFGYASAASARNQKYKCLERIREKLM